ncbi:MAG: hypothetical protein SGILL_004614 [Bacillariaceae sp.]
MGDLVGIYEYTDAEGNDVRIFGPEDLPPYEDMENFFDLPIPSSQQPLEEKAIQYAASIHSEYLKTMYHSIVVYGDFWVQPSKEGNGVIFLTKEQLAPIGFITTPKMIDRKTFCRADCSMGMFKNINKEAQVFMEVMLLYWLLKRYRSPIPAPVVAFLFRILFSEFASRRLWTESYEVAFLSANWGADNFQGDLKDTFVQVGWLYLPGDALALLGEVEETNKYWKKAAKVIDDESLIQRGPFIHEMVSWSATAWDRISRISADLGKVASMEEAEIGDPANSKRVDELISLYKKWAISVLSPEDADASEFPPKEIHLGYHLMVSLASVAGHSFESLGDFAPTEIHLELLKPEFHTSEKANAALFDAFNANSHADFHSKLKEAVWDDETMDVPPISDATEEMRKILDMRVMLNFRDWILGELPSDLPKCAICSKKSIDLKRCGACNAFDTFYCSTECQRKDWKKHKIICKKLQNAAKGTS